MDEVGWISQFHLLRPWWLLALLPLGLFGGFRLLGSSTLSRWRGIIAPQLLRHLLIAPDRDGLINPVNTTLLMGLLIIIAMSGPSWERRALPFSEDQAPLIIAVDLSVSMLQNDIQPTRIERAKQKILDLLDLRAGARTGLIAFAGSAHSVIPLTADADIIRNFLVAVEVGIMPTLSLAVCQVSA